jgi:hypothetical protein
MINCHKEYKKKLVSAEEAASLILEFLLPFDE